MKKIYKSLLAATLLAPVLTGCIEEVQPTNAISEEQLTSSSKATEAIVWAMSAFYNHYATYSSSYHYDYGYPSVMHIRDVMTGDMAIIPSGYDWYSSWESDENMGPEYVYAGFIWLYYTQLVLTTNNTISAIDEETANEAQLAYLSTAHAMRASHYLDMARMYEFLPNNAVSSINTDGNDVAYLTVPIVTEKLTEAEARNNPRATREEMFAFILSDLEMAEKYIPATNLSKTLPNLAAVYGLYARLYMWVENYPEAAKYAQMAIQQHGASNVTTDEQWLSLTNGFNTLSTPSWIWGGQCVKEDDVVQSGILNWTSWMSNETTFGYASAGPFVMIGASLYNQINDADFRKLSYVAPEGSALSGKEPMIDPSVLEEEGIIIPEYGSLKFRPGEANMIDYNIGCATAYPLMRVEEMYFIQAEAAAHTSPSEGKSLLESFMKNYRYSSYTCNAAGQEDVINEIILQKRIELWGEGQTFYDIKRLNMDVTRFYEGTNFGEDTQFNTIGRPAWMNFCILRTEGQNNEAILKFNNPDPSDKYTPGVAL